MATSRRPQTSSTIPPDTKTLSLTGQIAELCKPGTPYVTADPGSSCAWTAWRPVPDVGGIPWWRWSSWHCLSDWRPVRALEMLRTLAGGLGVKPEALLVFVEGQYLGRNPQTMIHTVLRRGHIEAAADVVGARCFTVPPTTWQALIRKPRDKGSLKRPMVKLRTKLLSLGERLENGTAVGAPEDVGDAFAVGAFVRQAAAARWAVKP